MASVRFVEVMTGTQGCSSEGEHNVVITMFHQSSSSGVTPSPGREDNAQRSQAGIKL